MKKQFTTFSIIIFLVLGCFFFVGSAYAETEVSGNITSDTNWTLTSSPYIVTATVQVLQGSKLTIEPGVVIKFNKSTGLVIDGEIYAVGDINNLITFTTNELNPNKLYKVPQDWYWGGIHIAKNAIGATFNVANDYLSGNIIKYSIIEYASTGLSDIDNSPLFIDNNIIRYNNRGINSYGKSVISNNVIDGNASYGIEINGGNPIIHHNQIINNSVEASFYPDFNVWGMAAIYFSGGGGQIYNNLIKDNGRGFSFSFYSNPEIKYNNIYNNHSRNFLMQQSANIQAKYNYLGSIEKSNIDSQIIDYYDNVGLGKVYYEPYALSELKFDGTDTFNQPQVCTSWTYSDWSACSSNSQQTRSVISSLPNGCSGGNPVLTQSCTYTPPTCTSWTYSDWGTCLNNQQTRTITSSQPANCAGGNPVLSQGCNSTPLCTENNWTSTLTPTNCPSSGQQTKGWTKIGQCQGGVSHPTEETVSCNYQTPTCTNFTYSDWGVCSSSGVQSRITLSVSPSGCTGGNPVLNKSCNYIPPCTSDLWSCGNWTDCSLNSSQTRICTKTFDCSDVQTESPITSQYCEILNKPTTQQTIQEVSQEQNTNDSQVTEQNQGQNIGAVNENTDKGNATSENKKNEHSTSTGQITVEEYRSTVANFVQSLLNTADREQGGIGEQVKLIAQQQNESASTTIKAMEQIQSRSKIKTFLIGSDYKNIGALRSEIVKTRNKIDQLNRTIESATDTAEIQAQIQTLEQEQVKIENFIKAQEGKFSLFGWLVKMFQ